MSEFWLGLWDTTDFVPRWACGNWNAALGWLHILADLAIWSAYLAMPVVLLYFAARRRDLPFRRIFWLFGAFLLVGGTTHLMEAVIFWWPVYRLAGLIKLVTALVAWGTVLALFRVLPQAMALRSPHELEREIADRRQVESQLLAMQAELESRVAARTARSRALIEASTQIVWTSNPRGSMEDDCPAWRMFTGQALEEWRGSGWLDALHPDDRASTRQAWMEAVRQSRPFQAEFRVRSADGRYHHLASRAVPVYGSDGTLTEWVGISIDVTEQRRAEQALREADRRKDEFLALLGHELRNPLAAITSAIQALDMIDGANPEVVEMRGVIHRQTHHMSRLIDDLLEVSRISRGKLQLKMQSLDLAAVARSAVYDLQTAAEAAGLELCISAPQTPVWMHGDPTRLSQVLVNLLQNAIKFTNPGGKVSVGLTCEPSASRVLLCVRDTGIGMDEGTLERIFEPFLQAEQSRDRSQGGLGLGLFLVKGLVELHGGQITCTSAGPGTGSEFVVSLPLAASAEKVEREVLPPVDPHPQLRILIIDDRRDAVLPLQTLLARLGHDVLVAHDAVQGLQLCRQTPLHVVLCDIGLPGELDGYAVAVALREDPATQHLYLVAITGYGKEEDRRRAVAAGFDEHLVKPASLDKLRRVLAQMPRPASANEDGGKDAEVRPTATHPAEPTKPSESADGGPS